MIYYIQLDKNNNVISYSSSRVDNKDIEIDEKDLEERFFNSPFFYVYKEISEKFEYREELYQAYLNKKNKPNQDDIFLKQFADIKLDNMKKDTIINNLISQVAEMKIENMKMKGSNK